MLLKVQDDHFDLNRLKNKKAKNAIIQKLSEDFNPTPLISKAFYSQFS